jgi:hypothetical protein
MGDRQAINGLAAALRRSEVLLAIAYARLLRSGRQLRGSKRLIEEAQTHLDAGVVRTRPAPGTPFAHSQPFTSACPPAPPR